jgi:PAS domain S-box-containing protein
MLARYLGYTEKLSTPAVVSLGSRGFYPNAAARNLFLREPESEAACLLEATRVLQGGHAVASSIAGRPMTFFPVFSDEGGIDAVIGLTAALSELPRIIFDVQTQLRYFPQILHHLPSIVVTARPNGRIDYLSRRWTEVTGRKLGVSTLHEEFFGGVPASDRLDVDIRWTQALASEAAFNFELRLETRDGTRWFDLQARPLHAAGSIIKWIVALNDVDEMVMARQELSRSVDRDREIAQTLQRAMLPVALPYAPGVRFDVAYETAESEALVGGDWYDAFEMSDGRIALTIGDVAGHGFSAAIVMSQVRQSIHTAVLEDADPATVLSRANRVVLAQRHPMVTAFFGVLDPLTLTLSFASAGHVPPALVREDGTVRELTCEGIPLGVEDEHHAVTFEEELEPGSALVLYTDGVVEDQRDLPSGERALHQRLSVWARGGFFTRAAGLQSGLRVGGHYDDAAMFIVHFPHLDQLELRLPATPLNARRLRLAVRRFVAGSPCRADRAFDAVLAVAEAINNAVEHAYSGEQGTVKVTMLRETQQLIVEVSDEGEWRDTSSAHRGRGLELMRRLADRVHVSKDNGGTVVRLEIGYTPVPAMVAAQA